MAQPIDLFPAKTENDDKIDLSIPSTSTLDTGTITDRAARYDYASGEESPGPDRIYQDIQAGRENNFRDYLARKQDNQTQATRQQMMTEFVKQKGGQPLTEPEFQFFNTLTYKELADPNTILEKQQAQRTVNDLYGSSSSPSTDPLQHRAFNESDTVANILQDQAEHVLANRLLAQRISEDLQSDFNSKNWMAKGEAWTNTIVGGALPFVYQWLTHDQVDTPYPSNFLTGPNKRAQFAYLMSLPPEQFYPTMKAAVDDFVHRGQPLLAQEFVGNFLGYTRQNEYLDTFFNVADIVGAAAVAGRPIVSAYKTSRSLASVRSAGKTFDTDAVRAARGETSGAVPRGEGVDIEEAVNDLASARQSPEDIAKELGISPKEVEDILSRSGERTAANEIERSAKTVPHPGDVTPDEEISRLLANNEQFADALKNTIKATDPGKPDLKEVAASAGKEDAAAAAKIHEDVAKETGFAPAGVMREAQEMEDLYSELPSFADPDIIFHGAYKTVRERTSQIAERLKRNTELLKNTLVGRGVSDIAADALDKAFEASVNAQKALADRGSFSDMVLDVRNIVPEENAANTAKTAMLLGRPGGGLFKTSEEAGYFLKQLNIPDAEIRTSGDSFVIQVTRDVDTSDIGLRSLLVDTRNKTPQSWFTTALDSVGLAKIRTPSNTLSPAQRGMRSKLINEMSRLSEVVGLIGKDISSLPKTSRRDLSRFLDMARRYEDKLPDGTPVKGIEFRTQGEFEQMWTHEFQRLPTPAESQAYWVANNLNQYDYILRNLAVYHYKARQGVRRWTASPKGREFEGKMVKSVDWDNPEGNIQVVDGKGETKTYIKPLIYKNPKSKKTREAIDRMINDEGHMLIQTVNPFDMESKAPIHFILTKTGDSRNLSYRQMPYRGGGHIRYDYGSYGKQARVHAGPDGINYFTGDTTVLPATTHAESIQNIKSLNTAQALYRAGDRAKFDKFVRENLPMEPDSLYNKFANGTLDQNIPFVAVRAGENTMKTAEMQQFLGTGYKSWQDSDLNMLKGMNMEFTGRRGWDISGITNGLDETDPMFELAKPRLVDPLPMISQALGRASRSRSLQPYQLRSAEHFIEEFHSVLEEGMNPEHLQWLRQNPMAVLHNPKWDIHTNDRRLLAAAKKYQLDTLNLIGTSTEFKRFEGWMRGKMMDAVYKRAGKNTSEKVYENLYRIPDPITFSRQVAFHMKLGLFNPVQLWLQMQTAATTFALSPRHTLPAVMATVLMRMMSVSKEAHFQGTGAFIEHFAGVASKLGWKHEDFKEAYNLMRESGIFNIGPQHAWRSDHLDPEVFRGAGKAFLDKGLFFFNEGERFNRMVGFLTAYREWRTAHKFDKVTREVMEDIMSRFDDLTVNMTHASSSSLNRGIGAVGGQFFSYQERMTELLLGHRLTWAERGRVLAIQSALWGVPVGGIGSATSFPFYEDVRKWQLQKGLKNNFGMELVTQGAIEALVLHQFLGSEFAYSSRMGPNGLQLWRDFVDGDFTVWQLLTGASQSVMRDTIESSYPVMRDIYDIVTDRDDSAVKVLMSDVVEVLKNVSSVNQGIKAYAALTTQKYLGKGLIAEDDEVNTQEALMMGVFGIKPTRIDDNHLLTKSVADRAAGQAYFRDQAKRYLTMMWGETDPEVKKGYEKRARTYMLLGDLSLKERSDLVTDTITTWRTGGEKARQSFGKAFPEVPQEDR